MSETLSYVYGYNISYDLLYQVSGDLLFNVKPVGETSNKVCSFKLRKRMSLFLYLSVYFRRQEDLQCPPDRARLLEQVALRSPHIHGLFLYHNGESYCSSLRERFIPDDEFDAATRDAEDGRLLLLNELKTFPGKVFLAYVLGNKDHGMVIAIDAYWLHHWFSADGLDGLIIDGKLLDRGLTVTNAPAVRVKITHLVGAPLSGFSVVSFRHDNRFLLFWPVVAMLALGLLIALWVCLYREKAFPTPQQLEMAILAGEIVPWYQPVMYAARNEARGVEVLTRWHHPGKGTLGTDTFIPLAEHSGLLILMTQTLLAQVRRDMEVLKFRLQANFHVSVNLNATPEMVDALADTLVSFHRSFPGRLSFVVELTEGSEVRFTGNCATQESAYGGHWYRSGQLWYGVFQYCRG